MSGNRLFIAGAGMSMLTKVRLLAALAAMEASAAIAESPTPVQEPFNLLRKDRKKAQWKTERRGRK